MISDRDVWAAALAIVKRYGEDAMLEASMRAEQLQDEGDTAGAETWHRIAPNTATSKSRSLARRRGDTKTPIRRT